MDKETIKEKVARITSWEEYACQEYLKLKKVAQDELKVIQGMCTHEDKTYHPDPSGNNNSEYGCNVCGKTGKKL